MKKAHKKNKKNASNPNPGDTVVVYNGPVALPRQNDAAATISVQMYLVHFVTTNGSGVANDVIGNNPAAFAEWVDFQSLWTEYRVLATEYTYVPSYQNVQGTLTFGPCVFVWNRYNNTALASISAAFQNESCVLGTLGSKVHRIIKMHDTLDAQYRSTNPGTTDGWWMKIYGSGYSNATTYGTVYLKSLVQFRGRL